MHGHMNIKFILGDYLFVPVMKLLWKRHGYSV